ncbi:hypothetical protein ACWT_8127 [Actinoplanes sp. SE50]|uniref:hypothetical protein n=1 Tax=unclassified Actinoplanes TaxID=2626549 RepID=UPI00023EDD46|nr:MULTISPECIES: hypothetical protein [unclassified Actinoplanes]AEV89136.1 hypothetical protein ACPL_8258 [Actinoplanes sp. SE50/110]ATO87542.1 hypothetical protein ACWT_8127 [Actinoplanes sp. SE50]SLM04960.1 hypothetical protein ACSP50_8275 [Actinoplanes sp. SE50/110]
MYRRGVSSRTRKLVIGAAATALLGSALAIGTGMSQAAVQPGAGSGGINALVPALGFGPGDPNATADRVGPTGVKVPGRCPPTQAQVNAQVALRNASFPSGTDLESRIQRFEKTLSAIQDLKCPASSTTLLGRLKSLTALRGNPDRDNILRGLGLNETPADKATATGSGDAAASGATGNAGAGSGGINALVPALGFGPGDPNATADRVGPTGVNVPGRCPPTQAQVNAQVALKNASFPSGTDLESRIQRFEKTLSAIQDLKCPASSTTLLGRLKSLTALRANPDRDNILRGLGLNETPADKAAGNAAPQNAPAK